jgi:outer membrane protein assembly factor BamD
MIQRSSSKLAIVLGLALIVAGCHHNKVTNPIANVNSKQPDKVLFDRAMDAMKHGKYDVARITLQTLINTYPDSEYIARAKLAVGDSWYAEGNAAAYQQAEVEYKDFETFFPNLPEAAEAQLKIANMHYKQMEKPDRDFTHAMRAEDEYRVLIQQYPDSKLVPEAKQRLREVQEVLAERQFGVGRFYYLRESYPAAIARLKTLADTYPLYSKADEVLMLLGRSYEAEANIVRTAKVANNKQNEEVKVRMIRDYQAKAGQAYDRIIERYPLSDRAEDARARLKDLGLPVPTPTKEAIAEYKAEEASRAELGHFASFMSTFHKAPDDLVRASKVGEPTLVDPQQTNAPDIIRQSMLTATGLGDGKSNVSIEKASPDNLKNDPVPRSDAPPAPATDAVPAAAAATPPATPSATNSGAGSDTGIGELTPNVGPAAGSQPAAAPTAADNANAAPGTATAPPNGTAAAASDTPAQAPPQVNEIQNGTEASNASPSKSNSSSDAGSSSSKKKKKKGLKKIVPF